MAKLLEVTCPCCQSLLKVDPATSAVISHKEPEKPKPIEDLAEAIRGLKGQAAKREDMFQKSFSAQKSASDVLNKKFDELLKQAKESPDDTPPKRDIDL
jgi:hypothetical protein